MMKATALCKQFDTTLALNGISISVPAGSIYGIVGSNGAGKSTLLRTLAGVYKPESGLLLVDGENPYENSRIKGTVFFLPDAHYFPFGMTPEKLRKFYLALYPNWDEGFYAELCKLFPLDGKKRIRDMSKGMQRQAMLVCALATRPKYLLLDEVFDGLDPLIRQKLRKLIAGEVADRGMTVLISTHNLRELEDLCDRLVLMHSGEIRLERDLDDLRENLCRVQAVFPQMPRLSLLREQLDLAGMRAEGAVLTVTARGSLEEVRQVLGNFSPTLMETVPLSLEDIFINEMEAAGYDTAI